MVIPEPALSGREEKKEENKGNMSGGGRKKMQSLTQMQGYLHLPYLSDNWQKLPIGTNKISALLWQVLLCIRDRSGILSEWKIKRKAR
jgi:hypothetical protein